MKVLVACEESQAVCIAFRLRGHEAFSCDIQECSGGHPEWHIQGDALVEAYSGKYDLMIAHPPCTYLTNAGIGYFNVDRYGEKAIIRKSKREEAMIFFEALYNAPIDRICVENPVGYPNAVFASPSQTIHPYFFGDPHKKRTCLWLKGLPLLRGIANYKEPQPLTVQYRQASKHYKGGEIKKRYFTDISGGSKKSAKRRSVTFPGIANAMADQWGKSLISITHCQSKPLSLF